MELNETRNQPENKMSAQQAREKLETAISEKSTEMLLDIARKMNLKTSTEEMLVSCSVERELEKRLSEEDFLNLMEELEAELDAA
jgi:hypothetical protein